MAMSRSGFPDSFASTQAGNLLPEILMERLHFNLRMAFFFPRDVLLSSLVFIRTFRYPFSLIPYHLYPYGPSEVIIMSAMYITPQVIRHHNVQSIDNWFYCLIYGKRYFADKVYILIFANNQRLYEFTYIPLTVVRLSSYFLLLSTLKEESWCQRWCKESTLAGYTKRNIVIVVLPVSVFQFLNGQCILLHM